MAKGKLSGTNVPAFCLGGSQLTGRNDGCTEIITRKARFFFTAIAKYSKVRNIDLPMLGFGIFSERGQINETREF